jgi:hypothetical protein
MVLRPISFRKRLKSCAGRIFGLAVDNNDCVLISGSGKRIITLSDANGFVYQRIRNAF